MTTATVQQTATATATATDVQTKASAERWCEYAIIANELKRIQQKLNELDSQKTVLRDKYNSCADAALKKLVYDLSDIVALYVIGDTSPDKPYTLYDDLQKLPEDFVKGLLASRLYSKDGKSYATLGASVKIIPPKGEKKGRIKVNSNLEIAEILEFLHAENGVYTKAVQNGSTACKSVTELKTMLEKGASGAPVYTSKFEKDRQIKDLPAVKRGSELNKIRNKLEKACQDLGLGSYLKDIDLIFGALTKANNQATRKEIEEFNALNSEKL